MKKILSALMLIGVIAALVISVPRTASAAGPQHVLVNWGDTLYSIATRYGTTVSALVQANKLPNANFVYAGQQLVIPSGDYVPASQSKSPAPSGSAATFYTVHAGDTLYSIAVRFGTSVAALAQLNHLWNNNFIYTGQQLRVVGTAAVPAPKPTVPPAAPSDVKPLTTGATTQPTKASDTTTVTTLPPAGSAAAAPVAGKWIDINIKKQTITAYEGATAVKTVLVSTGIAVHPTPVGKYKIYAKYSAVNMSGGTRGVDYYYLPNVPWTMFFYQGYAIHGTYWHHNFGHPMSHGCINLTIADAKWFYDWAPVGTQVVTHY
jgi:LysM repeat protein